MDGNSPKRHKRVSMRLKPNDPNAKGERNFMKNYLQAIRNMAKTDTQTTPSHQQQYEDLELPRTSTQNTTTPPPKEPNDDEGKLISSVSLHQLC